MAKGYSQFLFATTVLLVTSSIACAANVQNSNNKLCAFSIEGPITKGDSNTLAAVISKARIDQYDERTSSICLKSNGGSYVEGLKISEIIFDRGLSTVIESGAECYSACAIIFMSGVAPGREVPMRKLSVGGVLGFHAPYVTMPDEKYSKDDVELVAQGMRTAIHSLVQLASKQTRLHGGDFIKKSLISRILEKGPKEAFFVRTVYDAARWDILLYDAIQYWKKPSNVDAIKNICSNFHSSNMDEEQAAKATYSPVVEKYSSKFHKDDARILIKDASTNDTVCELYPRTFKSDGAVNFFACSFDYWSSKSFGNCREYLTAPAILVGKFVPEFLAYDPSTLLLRHRN
ncbi:hypothetical protein V1292_000071 [Bradyrhizobium sp. AZCC 1719]|uniref:hypothetical protein n=1 Tax=Bradyrhizobium sp. AZCC 1719 TaxID=3117028 RepID=UPI002FF0E90E